MRHDHPEPAPATVLAPAILEKHPAWIAWSRLTPESPAPARIDVLKYSAKSQVFRMHGMTPGGGALVAKRCRTNTGRVERLIYERWLAGRPALAPTWHGALPEDDGEFTWLFLESAGDAAYERERPEHRELAAAWLATLHGAADVDGAAAALPARGPAHYRSLLRSARRRLARGRRAPALTAADRGTLDALRADLRRLDERWEVIEESSASAPSTLVHGDLVAKNVRVDDREGSYALLAFDWENAGWGPPAGDLAQYTGETVSPALESYCAARSVAGGAAEALRLAACGRFFRLIDIIAWEMLPDATLSAVYFSKPMSCLRLYAGRLRGALEGAGWYR